YNLLAQLVPFLSNIAGAHSLLSVLLFYFIFIVCFPLGFWSRCSSKECLMVLKYVVFHSKIYEINRTKHVSLYLPGLDKPVYYLYFTLLWPNA
ncbi:hypothetical protein ACQP3J_29500, partial [Escherichia coli]